MIEFKKVVKKFDQHTVLNEISFKIQKGEVVFILGTSGTGKSVLLKNIVGLLRPTSGEIWVDGEEVSQLSELEYFAIRRKCGMVFQHPALFDSLTVFDNVAFGLRRHYRELNDVQIKEKVEACLALVHLSGIETKKPAEISYGMQKRVSLARTIAVSPQILLFDEPTTSLDPVTTNAVNQLIQRLSQELKATSVVVSHDMHCALDIADRIFILDQGKVIAQGSPEEIKTSSHELVRQFLEEVADD